MPSGFWPLRSRGLSGSSRGPPLPAQGPWLRPQLPSRPSRSVWLLLGESDSGGPGAQPRCAPEDAMAPGVCLDHVQGRRVKKQEQVKYSGHPSDSLVPRRVGRVLEGGLVGLLWAKAPPCGQSGLGRQACPCPTPRAWNKDPSSPRKLAGRWGSALCPPRAACFLGARRVLPGRWGFLLSPSLVLPTAFLA